MSVNKRLKTRKQAADLPGSDNDPAKSAKSIFLQPGWLLPPFAKKSMVPQEFRNPKVPPSV
ncbi:hypothetical protein HUJ05_012365 [Dendroctonus ponderosae]|nr:hypothetical protein HUJ05_012365 [Dendroctonus ponderosae]